MANPVSVGVLPLSMDIEAISEEQMEIIAAEFKKQEEAGRKVRETSRIIRTALKGGEGSGHHGHAGIPGHHGGSAPSKIGGKYPPAQPVREVTVVTEDGSKRVEYHQELDPKRALLVRSFNYFKESYGIQDFNVTDSDRERFSSFAKNLDTLTEQNRVDRVVHRLNHLMDTVAATLSRYQFHAGAWKDVEYYSATLYELLGDNVALLNTRTGDIRDVFVVLAMLRDQRYEALNPVPSPETLEYLIGKRSRIVLTQWEEDRSRVIVERQIMEESGNYGTYIKNADENLGHLDVMIRSYLDTGTFPEAEVIGGHEVRNLRQMALAKQALTDLRAHAAAKLAERQPELREVEKEMARLQSDPDATIDHVTPRVLQGLENTITTMDEVVAKELGLFNSRDSIRNTISSLTPREGSRLVVREIVPDGLIYFRNEWGEVPDPHHELELSWASQEVRRYADDTRAEVDKIIDAHTKDVAEITKNPEVQEAITAYRKWVDHSEPPESLGYQKEALVEETRLESDRVVAEAHDLLESARALLNEGHYDSDDYNDALGRVMDLSREAHRQRALNSYKMRTVEAGMLEVDGAEAAIAVHRTYNFTRREAELESIVTEISAIQDRAREYREEEDEDSYDDGGYGDYSRNNTSFDIDKLVKAQPLPDSIDTVKEMLSAVRENTAVEKLVSRTKIADSDDYFDEFDLTESAIDRINDIYSSGAAGNMDAREFIHNAFDFYDPKSKMGSMVTEISVGGGTVEVKGVVYNADTGSSVGSFTRIFDESGSVHHSYFKVRDEQTGFGSAFYLNAERMYLAAGFKRITIHANISVGGYSWARMGFTPDSSEQLRDFIHYAKREWESSYSEKFPKIKTIQELAALTGPDKRQIGKATLIGSSWSGTKMLDPFDTGFQSGLLYYTAKMRKRKKRTTKEVTLWFT